MHVDHANRTNVLMREKLLIASLVKLHTEDHGQSHLNIYQPGRAEVVVEDCADFQFFPNNPRMDGVHHASDSNPLSHTDFSISKIVVPRRYADMVKVWLKMQHRTNQIMQGPKYLTACLPWWLAASMEASEARGHLGYKWWKAQRTDEEQLRMELIDILHFTLSSFIQQVTDAFNKGQNVAGAVEESYKLGQTTKDIDLRGVSYSFDWDVLASQFIEHMFYQPGSITFSVVSDSLMATLSAFDFSCSYLKKISPNHFWQATFEVFTWATSTQPAEEAILDTVNRLYLGKNILNMFRQAYGEKFKQAIPYQRNWLGSHISGEVNQTKEDNVFLTEILSETDDAEAIWAGLFAKYRQHLVLSNQDPELVQESTLSGFLDAALSATLK